MPDAYAIDSGSLRRRVQIQLNTPSQNNLNQAVNCWSTIACRWASIEPASGSRFVATEQVRNDTTHKVVMRYYAGLTDRHRLVYKDRIFSILSVLNESEMNVRHTLLVQEVV